MQDCDEDTNVQALLAPIYVFLQTKDVIEQSSKFMDLSTLVAFVHTCTTLKNFMSHLMREVCNSCWLVSVRGEVVKG